MTPRSKRMQASYARELAGRRITLRRGGEPDCLARGRIVGFSEAEIVGGVQEGRRKLIVYAADITWADPLREGDVALIDGLELYVNAVDDQKRRVDGVLMAYEAEAGGR